MRKMLLVVAVIAAVSGIASHAVTKIVLNLEFKTAAKKVIKEYSNSVVLVKYTLSNNNPQFAAFGMPQDQTVISSAIVIADDIVATSAPRNQMMFFGQGGGNEAPNPKNIKVILHDGSQLSADFLIKDKNYSLMFVKVRKESLQSSKTKLTALNAPFSNAEAGDFALSIQRSNEEFGFAPRINLAIIESEITKPIKAYGTFLGWELTPIFDLKGSLIGFATSYDSGTDITAGRAGFLTLIIPADFAKQIFDKAKEAKPQVEESDDEENEEEENDEEEEEEEDK
jgi:hypothetical protein